MLSGTALLAQAVRSTNAKFAATVRETPEDKLRWKPLDAGRSILELALEVGALNGWAASVFNEQQTMPVLDDAAYRRVFQENDSKEKALALIAQGTEALATALESFPQDKLDDIVTLPFFGGMVMTFGDAALHVLAWNTTYHMGQACYIQTLYGDKDMHWA